MEGTNQNLHSQRGSERGLKVKTESCNLCQRNQLFIIAACLKLGFVDPQLMLLGPPKEK